MDLEIVYTNEEVLYTLKAYLCFIICMFELSFTIESHYDYSII